MNDTRVSSSLTGRLVDLWWRGESAAVFVVVRVAYGLTVLGWSISLLPDRGRIFGDDGLHREPYFRRWDVTNLFRWVDGEVVLSAALIMLLVASAAVVAGRAVRLSLPLAAYLQFTLAGYADPWAIGAEDVLRLIGLFLAAGAIVLPASSFRWTEHPTPVPRWPLVLIRIQLVVLYFTTAFEKSRGGEWHDGSAVFQALEIEHLRRFGAPDVLRDTELFVQAMTYGTLVVEFALPVLLLWPRTRRIGIVVGVLMHVGFDLFLELGFFGPAMIVGLLSFLPARDAERIVGWFGRDRPATVNILVDD